MKRKQIKLTRKEIYEAGARCCSAGDIILINILNQILKSNEKQAQQGKGKILYTEAIKAQSDKGPS